MFIPKYTDTYMSTFQIHYKKESVIDPQYLATQYDSVIESSTPEYNPFRIHQIQNYNPIYGLFFDLNDSNYHKITLNQKYGIRGESLVERETGEIVERPVFFKFSPLLDPIRYMVGKYDLTDPHLKTLPTLSNSGVCFPKIADTNNVSYIDSFFSYLASQLLHTHNVFHSVDFYGSYLGIQEMFKTAITDDIEYLQSSPFFMQHLNNLFFADSPVFAEYTKYGSKSNRNRIRVSKSSRAISIDAEDLEELPGSPDLTTEETTEVVYEKQMGGSRASSANSDDDSHSSQNSADLNYSSSDEDDDEQLDMGDLDMGDEDEDEDLDSEGDSSRTQSEETDEEESEVYGFIKDYPTQMICLEKCNGTLDELFLKDKIDEENAASCLFQIVMTLLIYSKTFDLTHNDLHTNNIVYSDTEIEYIYYCYQSKYYRVPTYGRIFKIIDFGRSIYRYQGKLFCSDSFAKYSDAHTQYNFPPYMNESKPRVDPNPSFDLCRLGCSIYDFVVDEMGEIETELQKTIARWCSDNNGKNVLYKRNGDERYPGFKLYKMISRNVHAHTPEAQLQYPYFSQFEISMKKLKKYDKTQILANGINIDTIPSYV